MASREYEKRPSKHTIPQLIYIPQPQLSLLRPIEIPKGVGMFYSRFFIFPEAEAEEGMYHSASSTQVCR